MAAPPPERAGDQAGSKRGSKYFTKEHTEGLLQLYAGLKETTSRKDLWETVYDKFLVEFPDLPFTVTANSLKEKVNACLSDGRKGTAAKYLKVTLDRLGLNAPTIHTPHGALRESLVVEPCIAVHDTEDVEEVVSLSASEPSARNSESSTSFSPEKTATSRGRKRNAQQRDAFMESLLIVMKKTVEIEEKRVELEKQRLELERDALKAQLQAYGEESMHRMAIYQLELDKKALKYPEQPK